MTTNCCTSCGIAARASPESCAADADIAAATSRTGTENLAIFFSTFILREAERLLRSLHLGEQEKHRILHNQFTPVLIFRRARSTYWYCYLRRAMRGVSQAAAPGSLFDHRTHLTDASIRFPAHMQLLESAL